jgi:hypothetical protein
MADYFYNPIAAPGLILGFIGMSVSENNFIINSRMRTNVDHTTVAPAADVTSGFLSAQIDMSAYKRIKIKNIIIHTSIAVYSGSILISQLNNINLLEIFTNCSIGFHSGAFNPTAFNSNNQNLYIPPVYNFNNLTFSSYPYSTLNVDINHNIISNNFFSIIMGFNSPFLYSQDYALQYALWIASLGLPSINTIASYLKISVLGEIY